MLKAEVRSIKSNLAYAWHMLDTLSYKTAILLSLCSAKHIGDSRALSVHLLCTQFELDNSKVVLRPNLAFII